MDYRTFDLATLEREYSPSSRIEDIRVHLDGYAARSAMAREHAHHCLRYGPRPEQALDYFPAEQPGAPLLVYVHGGYWQELGKDDSAFAAPGLLAGGIAFAALGYGLSPAYSLDEVVAMVREGLWWLASNLRTLPGGPAELHLSGSSAGAHLVAMALVEGWLPDGLHPADVFGSATLLSGVYDLEPLIPTYVNEALRLDTAAAVRNSPLSQVPRRAPALVLAVGENETSEFLRQHHEFAEAITPAAPSVTNAVVKGRNHFDLPYDIGSPDTELGAAVLAAIRSGRAPTRR